MMLAFCYGRYFMAKIEEASVKNTFASSLNQEKGVPWQLLAKRTLEETWPCTVRLAAASQHDSLVFMLAFFCGDHGSQVRFLHLRIFLHPPACCVVVLVRVAALT